MERVPNKPALQVKKSPTAPSAAGFRRGMDHNNYEGLALALFEETDEALILFDAKTRQVLDVNAAAQRLCGLCVRDLLEAPISSLFRSADWEKIESKSLSGRKVHFPFAEWGAQLRTFDVGNWLSVDFTVTRLVVKPGPLILVTIRGVDHAVDGDSIRRYSDRPIQQKGSETKQECS
jgi:PAS domain